jgi:hypothetical protein
MFLDLAVFAFLLSCRNPGHRITYAVEIPLPFGKTPIPDIPILKQAKADTRRGILGSRTGQRCRQRIPEDSRPQRDRLELLDGSVGASGSGSRQRLAVENFAGADAARVRALAAYKDFLTLWKDADPDIPILKEARAEYAKLQ